MEICECLDKIKEEFGQYSDGKVIRCNNCEGITQ